MYMTILKYTCNLGHTCMSQILLQIRLNLYKELTFAASTSFAVASASTLAAARRRFCESESSWVSASALMPVTKEDDTLQ